MVILTRSRPTTTLQAGIDRRNRRELDAAFVKRANDLSDKIKVVVIVGGLLEKLQLEAAGINEKVLIVIPMTFCDSWESIGIYPEAHW